MRQRKNAAHYRDRNRAFLAAGLLLLICVSSLYLARNKVIKANEGWYSAGLIGMGAGLPKPASRDESPDGYRTNGGAVLFVPVQGNLCRKRVIDNKTWRISDKGYATCDEAVSWNANRQGQPYQAASRVEAIRSGFFKK